MRNDLKSLPFRAGQLHYASNYYEAAGILSAMKAGVAPATIARPMLPIRVEHVSATVETNGHTNGHANGHKNGHTTNGANGKTRRTKTTVVDTTNASEILVEVNGK
jgi:hypothetical protein